MSIENIFERIYSGESWRNNNKYIPLSGEGSTRINSEPYTNLVNEVIARKKIASVVDCGHGDWKMWNPNSFQNIQYIGIDVVSNLSNQLQNSMGNSRRQFISGDISEMTLPKADLLISKDVLQHLSLKKISRFVEKLHPYPFMIICNDYFPRINSWARLKLKMQVRTRYRTLLSGCNPFYSVCSKNNGKILDGGYRGIDLEVEPFREILKGFELIDQIDFHAPKRKYVVKRIYVLKKL